MGWGLFWGALVVSCFAGHSRRAAAGNCALYARAVTGVDLYGAAGGWWDEAAGRYQRSQAPVVGAILVFRATGSMPSGHVAVVSKVVGPTMVLVDQSNWYHGRVTLGTPVVDTSSSHDWTRVAVMELGSGQFGRDNPTFGFVYPEGGAGGFGAVAGSGGFARQFAASRDATDEGQPAGLFHFAVADEYRGGAARGRGTGPGWTARYWIRLAPAAHRRGQARTIDSAILRSTHRQMRRNEGSRRRQPYRTASAG